MTARETNAKLLSETLATLFAQRSAAEWEQELIAAGVGCVEASGKVLGGFLLEDEHVPANGWAVEAVHTLWNRYRRWGPAVTFSECEGRLGPAVLAGEHADALLAELGCDAAEIARLRKSGAVADSEGDNAAPWIEKSEVLGS